MKTPQLPDSVRHFDALPDTALIPFGTLSLVVGRSRASVYRDIESGALPEPTKAAGPRSQNMWVVGAVRRAIQARAVS